LLGAGVPIIENPNLQRVAAGIYDEVAFPIRIDGATVRPAAWRWAHADLE
jgi:hypothetical protein